MTRAPLPNNSLMVGKAATIRLSSLMTPYLIGTLKSTLTTTLLPATSNSLTVNIVKSPIFLYKMAPMNNTGANFN